MQRKKMPLKVAAPRGAEGQALIANNQDGLQQDNLFVPTEVKWCKDTTKKLYDVDGKIIGEEVIPGFMPYNTRKGWDKGIFSNGKLVNLVGSGYGHLDNLHFFGEVENKLLEKDIKVLTRYINRDDAAFAADYILNDDRYVVNVKNSNDKIRPMMTFTNSYDGSTKTQGRFGFFREVCRNGLHVATSEIGFSLKHRGNIVQLVLPEIQILIERFMDNEYYEIKKRFEVLAEKPIKNLYEYVEFVCAKTEIFKYQKSEENEEASKKAETVVENIRREAKLLGEETNAWLGYNGFNSVLFNNMKKGFNAQFNFDRELFEATMEYVN